MPLQFKPLKLDQPDVFGVSLSGCMGRGDRDRLKELADKCLLNGKTKVLLDLSELGSLGGGGARMIAELQERLEEADGGTVIAGAGETVKRFLNQKFEDNPLTYCSSVEEALCQFGSSQASVSAPVVGTALEDPPAEISEPEEAVEEEEETSTGEALEVGAVGFCDDDADGEMDNLLDEFKAAETKKGRRKDHRFTSLHEAMTLLGDYSDRSSKIEFGQALKNLLFSQGLAEDVTLLMAHGGLMASPDGYKEIPLDGTLAIQAEEMARPLTMLDVLDDELTEEEILLLEAVDPDLILPILRQGSLNLLIFIKKGGEDREYSVAESFAFELLQQILESAEETKATEAQFQALKKEKVSSTDAKVEDAAVPEDGLDYANLSTDFSAIMLKMSLDMPEADDLPHFWRLFARHLESQMQLEEMALLETGQTHPQIMLGGDNSLIDLDFSDERLKKYFQSLECPVNVDNLPTSFKLEKKVLKASRVNWVIALNHEGVRLGTLLLHGSIKDEGEFSDQLVETFNLASGLMKRFSTQSDDADVYLDLIYRLMTQREKRIFGSEEVTRAIVDQLTSLAAEMGFPSDQKRDLIYGCLMRDIGLIDKDDALMGSPADMTPNQWKAYRSHPSDGAALLKDLNLSQTVLEVVNCHHERFNGEGFPGGLNGRDIPLAARVVTVVENFVAMTTGVGGLEPRSAKDAAEVLRENLGERYDPDIVSIFLSVVGQK